MAKKEKGRKAAYVVTPSHKDLLSSIQNLLVISPRQSLKKNLAMAGNMSESTLKFLNCSDDSKNNILNPSTPRNRMVAQPQEHGKGSNQLLEGEMEISENTPPNSKYLSALAKECNDIPYS